jgi:hypothetical protein
MDTILALLVLLVVELALVGFLEHSGACISDFQARKLCHSGTGLVLLQLDSREPQARQFVYIVGLGALAVTWGLVPRIKPFRFARRHDEGMTVFMIVAMIWFYMELPIQVLAPMFFADPAGAVVGKYLSGLKEYGVKNPIWWRGGGTQKSVGGSAAVLFFTMLTFASPATLLQRFVIGVLAVFFEALGGAFDNLLLVLLVVGSRMYLNFQEYGEYSLSVSSGAPASVSMPTVVSAFIAVRRQAHGNVFLRPRTVLPWLSS